MNFMFHKASFNSDINRWDVEHVRSMLGLFWGAASFRGDVSSWINNTDDPIEGLFEALS